MAAVAACVTLVCGIIGILDKWFVIDGPLPLVALICGLVSMAIWFPVALRAERRQKRRRLGVCVACGYDLRATPDGCPECGAVSTGLDNVL